MGVIHGGPILTTESLVLGWSSKHGPRDLHILASVSHHWKQQLEVRSYQWPLWTNVWDRGRSIVLEWCRPLRHILFEEGGRLWWHLFGVMTLVGYGKKHTWTSEALRSSCWLCAILKGLVKEEKEDDECIESDPEDVTFLWSQHQSSTDPVLERATVFFGREF